MSVKKINVALVGFGYWGPNLARNIALNSSYQLIAIIDQLESRRIIAESVYGVSTYSSYDEIDNLQALDLVVICTRPSSHKKLAKYFIKNQVNVLITKPCGISFVDAEEIAVLAEEYGVKAYCDFTYHFSPLVDFLVSDSSVAKVIEEMHEYTSYRTSLGIVQSDVDVLADLAVHDIYILLLLKSELPLFVNCLRTGSSVGSKLHAAVLTLTWADGFISVVHVSWSSPKKVRLITISSKGRGVLVEEMNREAPIQIVEFQSNSSQYDTLTVEEKYSRNVSYTMGNLQVPQIDMYEALAKEMEEIAKALNTSNDSLKIPTARSAANVWRIVEALRESDRKDGAPHYV
jgi:predicted dehydrogenase